MTLSDWREKAVAKAHDRAAFDCGEAELIPALVKRGLARYDVPVFRLGRLAVDRTVQGLGLNGKLLLAAGLQRDIARWNHENPNSGRSRSE